MRSSPESNIRARRLTKTLAATLGLVTLTAGCNNIFPYSPPKAATIQEYSPSEAATTTTIVVTPKAGTKAAAKAATKKAGVVPNPVQPVIATANAAPTVLNIPYVDASRGRSLPTLVDIPAGHQRHALIMFAEGRGNQISPATYQTELLAPLAQRGFVVAAVSFPDNGDPNWPAKIADQAYVINALEHDPRVDDDLLPGKVVLGGHSDGGLIDESAACGPAAERITGVDAVFALSGADIFGGGTCPGGLLLIHGAGDHLNPISSSYIAYADLQTPPNEKFLAVLPYADHDNYLFYPTAPVMTNAALDMITTFTNHILFNDPTTVPQEAAHLGEGTVTLQNNLKQVIG